MNPRVRAVSPPPVAEAQAWSRGRRFPEAKPLLDPAQAVASNAPALDVARRLAERYNVPCLPEIYFGPGQEPYLRLAFANRESRDFDALADRLLAIQNGA